ncbi:hypothetical protein [Vagococcus intermedius]|uniref:Uncharacterized protein n=1 Tax=Vagococcus intermedius TaxID=2991418 RepID=A0AAF0CWG3_9ENTE|nr:hypothetical protein [Vagococcus intermedius]WEG74149.1 hypothetical protein OL234_04440 [Vagococcus intermedius]WEG76229.1 hypothetical protein OL235_04445 [Vagococcus intermedius]
MDKFKKIKESNNTVEEPNSQIQESTNSIEKSVDQIQELSSTTNTPNENINHEIEKPNSNSKKLDSDIIARFLQIVKDKKELIILAFLSIVLASLFITFVVPNIHKKIVWKQTEALVDHHFANDKNVLLIRPYELGETIASEKNITIAMFNQNNKLYPKFEIAVNNERKMSNYTGKLYLYPIIFDVEETQKFYKVDNKITLIHFENKKETSRKELTSEKEIDLYLADYLNSLERGEDVPEVAENGTTNDEATSVEEMPDKAKANAKSDIIDELKDVIK